MGSYKEVKGDLIVMAKNGDFDVIAHGCNCFCTMGAGIAVAMKNEFEAHQAPLENTHYKGDVNKMGQIDCFVPDDYPDLTVVNAYTQFGYGNPAGDLDYEALTLCMRKISSKFRNKHIGLPLIGAGLAGGDWVKIQKIIKDELEHCYVTVVHYKP